MRWLRYPAGLRNANPVVEQQKDRWRARVGHNGRDWPSVLLDQSGRDGKKTRKYLCYLILQPIWGLDVYLKSGNDYIPCLKFSLKVSQQAEQICFTQLSLRVFLHDIVKLIYMNDIMTTQIITLTVQLIICWSCSRSIVPGSFSLEDTNEVVALFKCPTVWFELLVAITNNREAGNCQQKWVYPSEEAPCLIVTVT